jgi:hypothetical protein
VALSLNIDPKKLRRASTRALIAGREFGEGPEFEQRLALAKLCLGETLPGPVNHSGWHYYSEAPKVRFREFAEWARSVQWQMPAELARLAAGGAQSGDVPDSDSNKRQALPEEVRVSSAEKSAGVAGEPREVATKRTIASHASGIRTVSDETAEGACGEWIAGLPERPRNKETAFADAKDAVANIGTLSYKAFERAWATNARDDWKKPGRRKETNWPTTSKIKSR